MVEFQLSEDPPDYSGPLEDDPRIEEPIIPLSELGTTVVETDPKTGGHILSNIEGVIRKGASTMQLMWQTDRGQAIGGRPKAYGKDVRLAIREMLEANEVELSGSELPTSLNNLSGFDGQRGTISEQKRQQDIQEVKDAIDFQVDVAGGGGVDIVSMEYMRSISDERKTINKNKKYQFYDYSEKELEYEKELQKFADGEIDKIDEEKFQNKIEGVKYLYDERTGQVISDIRKSNVFNVPKYMKAKDVEDQNNRLGKKSAFIGKKDEHKKEIKGGDGRITKDDFVDMDGKWLNPENAEDQFRRIPSWDEKKAQFKSDKLDWAEIVRRTERFNEKCSKKDEQRTPEEMVFHLQLDNQILQQRGSSLFHNRDYEARRENMLKLQEARDSYNTRDEELQRIFKNDQKGYEFARLQEAKNTASQLAMGEPTESAVSSLAQNPDDFFKKRIRGEEQTLKFIHESSASADSRADELEERKKHVKTTDKIAKANTQESYAELGIYAMNKGKDPRSNRDTYVGPELGWPTTFGGHPEEFIEIIEGARKKMTNTLMRTQNMSQSEAKEKAKTHIRGDFDTSHLAMWYNHFEAKKGESEEKKLKRFNKWYIDMVDEMHEKDVIGSIQVVDAITGQHSHLPAGQGIFPVVDAVKRLKEKGWKGDIVSEGHEEEKFGDGRILTETWKAFGSHIGSGYSAGGRAPGPQTFGGVQQSYFGATQSPTYIVGAYVPSNEWSLWSEVPFE